MSLRKIVKSFLDACRGLKTVWKEENNFRIESIVALAVLATLFFFDFSYVEIALAVIAIVLVLLGEIVNTAVEDLCNKVEPQYDETIGKIKDMMASFMLVAVVSSVILGFLILRNAGLI